MTNRPIRRQSSSMQTQRSAQEAAGQVILDMLREDRDNVRETLTSLADGVHEVRTAVSVLSNTISALRVSVDTNQEGMKRLLSTEVYQTAHNELKARVDKLEGAPHRLMGWLGLGVAAVSLLFTLGEGALVGIIWLISHH